MHSQLYLSGQLATDPEKTQTKKGRLMVRILLQTELFRDHGQDGIQCENVMLPVSLFSFEAEAVKNLVKGDSLTIGCHLYGTKFETPDGAVKHGCQIIADSILGTQSEAKE